jgi:hypothetical protein
MGVGGGHALVYRVANTSDEPLWVLVDFDEPNGDRLCGFIKKIEPGAGHLFECPLTTPVVADQEYRLRLSVYADDRLASRIAGVDPVFRANQTDLAAFEELRATIPEPRPAALGRSVDDAAPSPNLPAVFEPTWFRHLQRRLSLAAYEDSGRLTVDTDALLFTSDETTIRVPFAQISSVRLESMPSDPVNNWVVVRFTADDNKPEGVGFKDGAWLGNSNGEGMIFLTIRRAARK